MRSRSMSARVVALVALCATIVPATPAPASHSSRLAETRREIAATRRKLAAVIHSDQEILSALRVINARLARERSTLAAAQLKLTRIDLAIRAEERRLVELERNARARKAIINARARALYMMGPVDDLDALTGATSLDQYVQRAGVLDAVATFDRRVLQDLAALRHETVLAQRALREQRAEQKAARDEVAERVSTVAEYASVKQEAHAVLDRQIDALRAELAAEQREQARIIALIRSRASVGSVDTGGSGRLGFAWPIRGRITSPYGPRWGGYHTGIDIDCRTGAPIGASKAGRVIEAGWGGGYGRMVIVDHGGGYTTLYAHMSRIYVGYGSSVSQGTKVGACGESGNATGDHLHFEVRVNGDHRNPRNYLP